MNGAYLDAIATHGETLITHIGLVDSTGTPVGGARQAVTWTGPNAGDGLIRPSADLQFNITAGEQVQGWRGYDALTAGTDYGGTDVATPTAVYGNDGTFTLDSATTGIDHDAA